MWGVHIYKNSNYMIAFCLSQKKRFKLMTYLNIVVTVYIKSILSASSVPFPVRYTFSGYGFTCSFISPLIQITPCH